MMNDEVASLGRSMFDVPCSLFWQFVVPYSTGFFILNIEISNPDAPKLVRIPTTRVVQRMMNDEVAYFDIRDSIFLVH